VGIFKIVSYFVFFANIELHFIISVAYTTHCVGRLLVTNTVKEVIRPPVKYCINILEKLGRNNSYVVQEIL
jgi:hypothetical protein